MGDAGDLAEGQPDESGVSEAPIPSRGRAPSSGGKLGTVLLLGAMIAFSGTTSLSALCCGKAWLLSHSGQLELLDNSTIPASQGTLAQLLGVTPLCHIAWEEIMTQACVPSR